MRQFSTTLISPSENSVSSGRTHPLEGFYGAKGYREPLLSNLPYVVGEHQIYESHLMIDDQCSSQKICDVYAAYNGLDTFSVSGTVADIARPRRSQPTC